MILTLTEYKGIKMTWTGKVMKYQWEDFCWKCSHPFRYGIKLDDYEKLPKDFKKDEYEKAKAEGHPIEWHESRQGIKEHNGGFVFAEIHVPDGMEIGRKKDYFLERNGITFDYEKCGDDIYSRIKNGLNGLTYCYYTTCTHNPLENDYRLRIVIPFAKTVDWKLFSLATVEFAKKIGMEGIDDTCIQADRLMLYPVLIRQDEHEWKDKIKTQYKYALKKTFGGELFASGDIVRDVNDWVSKNTRGMIEQIASEKNAEMISCFMNAVAFKAYWCNEYDDDDVKENLFYNADGSKQKVKMLSGTEYDYVEDERFTGFVKEYDSDYSFMALLPKKKSQEFLYEALSQVNFKNIFMAKVDEDVEIKMPEFKFSYEADLLDFCQKQGIETIFTSNADFAPMTEEWLKVESIAHKAIIKVDRNGTEAAAVTFSIMDLGCLPKSFKRKRRIVKLNRPFIFAIMHKETGLPVFIGVVNSVDKNAE